MSTITSTQIEAKDWSSWYAIVAITFVSFLILILPSFLDIESYRLGYRKRMIMEQIMIIATILFVLGLIVTLGGLLAMCY